MPATVPPEAVAAGNPQLADRCAKEEAVTDRSTVVKIATSLVGRGPDCCATAAPGYDLSRVSWCQILWLHCLREAGLTADTWADVANSGWTAGWLGKRGGGTTQDPQPGDLGYIAEPNQHGAVVQRVEGDRVYTVDGNSTGCVVRLRERVRHEFTCFYSIECLLGNGGASDTEPSPPPSEPDLPLGVDVSAYQAPSSVNWRLLRELGYSFMYARGVRMGRELDDTAPDHIQRARDAGFAVGLYAFFDPRHEPAKQFDLMIDAHSVCGVRSGDLAPVLDLESIHNGPQSSREWVTPTAAILDSYRHHWTSAVRYHNVNDWHRMGKPDALEQYPLWLADYTPPADLECSIWQMRSAPIPGYGTVTMDQNVAYELPRVGHEPAPVERQRPPLFDLRSTPESRWAARDEWIRNHPNE